MTQENEILAAARGAKASEPGAAKAEEAARARRWRVGQIGLGVGIGSAALAAALMYANRDRT